jgi:hypothetical protein
VEVIATTRSIKPEQLEIAIRFTPDELKRIFEDNPTPDKDTYFKAFSGEWEELDPTARIEVALIIAEAIKASEPAKDSNPTLQVEDKGTAP